MKKTVVTVAITALCTAALLLLGLKLTNASFADTRASDLAKAAASVQKSWSYRSDMLSRQLRAFASSIAVNNDFSLKMLVEHDRSSGVITGIAGQFMKPMGFSALEILDSSSTVLSSGHFPANAGNKSVNLKGLSDTPAVCPENVMGQKKLSLQCAVRFTIADFPFYVAGGVIIDSLFLAGLTPSENVGLILRYDDDFISTIDSIHSLSAIEKNEVIVNDRKYPATNIRIAVSGTGDSLSLFVVLK